MDFDPWSTVNNNLDRDLPEGTDLTTGLSIFCPPCPKSVVDICNSEPIAMNQRTIVYEFVNLFDWIGCPSSPPLNDHMLDFFRLILSPLPFRACWRLSTWVSRSELDFPILQDRRETKCTKRFAPSALSVGQTITWCRGLDWRVDLVCIYSDTLENVAILPIFCVVRVVWRAGNIACPTHGHVFSSDPTQCILKEHWLKPGCQLTHTFKKI